MTGIKLTECIYKAIDDKKGNNIIVLNMQGVSDIADYCLICSAGSDVQARAIADHIDESLGKIGVFPIAQEGYSTGEWILLDYAYCVVHIFIESEREYYDLEKLWLRAERVDTTNFVS